MENKVLDITVVRISPEFELGRDIWVYLKASHIELDSICGKFCLLVGNWRTSKSIYYFLKLCGRYIEEWKRWVDEEVACLIACFVEVGMKSCSGSVNEREGSRCINGPSIV